MTLTENRWRRPVMVSTIFPMIGSILSLEMGNGTRAFAVAVEQPKKGNTLRTAEMTLEDDYDISLISAYSIVKHSLYTVSFPPYTPLELSASSIF